MAEYKEPGAGGYQGLVTRREFLLQLAGVGAASALASCAGGIPSLRAGTRFDTIIIGGAVIDGTGAPERLTDIGILDGRVAALGDLREATARRVIDAAGLKVSPGFVDIHSHVDVELFRNPRAESKVRQGVTTEVTGMDGESVAPLAGPELDRTLSAFKEDIGYECPYRDMDGFLSSLQENGCAQNILSMVGLGTVRGAVIGMENRPASPEEMEAMTREVMRAIEQGCWGVSTGLEYTPGSFASAEEIWKILSAVPERYRLYSTHMRNEDNTLLEAIDEAIAISRNARASLQVSHLKASYKVNWHKQEKAIRALEDARATGVNAHADRYPYIAYNTDLAALFPLWSREGGNEKFLDRLRDKTVLPRIREAVEKKINGLGSWDAVMISSVRTEQSKPLQGKTMAQIAALQGGDPFEVLVDLIVREDGRVGMVGFGMDEAGTEMVLAWKYTIIASDAGSSSPTSSTSRPHPRSYGTFPRAIAHYQRGRKITTLADMIRKMTSLPAEKLGLKDRGVIAVGNWADLVLFDYEKVEDRATFLDPHQFPAGIPWVLVNGETVVEDDLQTDALPGRVLRSS